MSSNERLRVLMDLATCMSVDWDDFKNAFPVSLAEDEAFFRSAVKHHGLVLQVGAPLIKANKEIVLAAVAENPYALLYADKAFQDDPEVVLMALKTRTSMYARDLPFPRHMLESETFVRSMLAANGTNLRYLGEADANRLDYLELALVNKPYMLEMVYPEFQVDLETYYPEALRSLVTAVSSNAEFLHRIVMQNELAYKHIGQSMRASDAFLNLFLADFNNLQIPEKANKRKVQLRLLMQVLCDRPADEHIFLACYTLAKENHLPTRKMLLQSRAVFYNNKRLMEALLTIDSEALEFAHASIKRTPELIRLAIASGQEACTEKRPPSALKYAATNLKDDRAIVLEAVKKDGAALEYASTRLQIDLELIKLAIANGGAYFWAFLLASRLCN